MKIGLAQINTIPGDIIGNYTKIYDAYKRLSQEGAELVLCPEMALFGYWPGDLLLYKDKVLSQVEALKALAQKTTNVPLVVGCVLPNPEPIGLPLFNAAACCLEGRIETYAKKCLLPNYNIFDEQRHFEAATNVTIFHYQGKKIGISICEDIWSSNAVSSKRRYLLEPLQDFAEAKIDLLLNLSASPWSHTHVEKRLQVIKSAAQQVKAPVVYCNLVGGNEELLFDGRSLCMDPAGNITFGLNSFKEEEAIVDLANTHASISPHFFDRGLQDIWRALVFGIQEYAKKAGFKQALLGLSGGIDSALVATLAKEALGAENVLAVALPSAISSPESLSDAQALAKNLDIECLCIPIHELVKSSQEALSSRFEGQKKDLTEENIQARARGLLLMGIANKENRLLLTTGNKSELAVGYCTLYGDMCGGLNPLGDLYKTDVYALANAINEKGILIPQSIIEKAPSAELRPGQKDIDSLPPYPLLDSILKALLESHQSIEDLIHEGFDSSTIRWVAQQVNQSEYKRKQAAPILRCQEIAFGMGRRMPIIRG